MNAYFWVRFNSYVLENFSEEILKFEEYRQLSNFLKGLLPSFYKYIDLLPVEDSAVTDENIIDEFIYKNDMCSIPCNGRPSKCSGVAE